MSDRDCWATPKWLTDLLPSVDLDPCSNAQSTVRALRTYDLSRDEDGLRLPWFGSVYVNPPYSDVTPWADKLHNEDDVEAAAFLMLQWSRRSSSTERIRTNHSVIFTGYTSKCEHLRAG